MQCRHYSDRLELFLVLNITTLMLPLYLVCSLAIYMTVSLYYSNLFFRPLNFAINPDDYDLQCIKKPKTPRVRTVLHVYTCLPGMVL